MYQNNQRRTVDTKIFFKGSYLQHMHWDWPYRRVQYIQEVYAYILECIEEQTNYWKHINFDMR